MFKFTSSVVCDLVNYYYQDSPQIIIKSNNYKLQYKCGSIFGFYRSLAIELQGDSKKSIQNDFLQFRVLIGNDMSIDDYGMKNLPF